VVVATASGSTSGFSSATRTGSRFDAGDADVVVIDGDHSYDGARARFERFGRPARTGGHLLFDDGVDDGADAPLAPGQPDTVGRVEELDAGGEFRLRARIDRLAHLERSS
jgi:hypothetical protein